MTATGYGKAQVGSGQFDIPDLEDGEYNASVKNVKDSTGSWEGVEYPQYIIEYELEDAVDPETGLPMVLAQFVKIPDKLVENGLLHESSTLYGVMAAFGIDMKAEAVEVEPAQWVGKAVRIYVEQYAPKTGKNAGISRPRITKVKPPKGQMKARANGNSTDF